MKTRHIIYALAVAATALLGRNTLHAQVNDTPKLGETTEADGSVTTTKMSDNGFYFLSETTDKSRKKWVGNGEIDNYNQPQVRAIADYSMAQCGSPRLVYFQQHGKLSPREAAAEVTREMVHSIITNLTREINSITGRETMSPTSMAQGMLDMKVAFCLGDKQLEGLGINGVAGLSENGSYVIAVPPPEESDPFNTSRVERGIDSAERLYLLVGRHGNATLVDQTVTTNRPDLVDLCASRNANVVHCELKTALSDSWAEVVSKGGFANGVLARRNYTLPQPSVR